MSYYGGLCVCVCVCVCAWIQDKISQEKIPRNKIYLDIITEHKIPQYIIQESKEGQKTDNTLFFIY